MSQECPAPKLYLWVAFSILTLSPYILNWGSPKASQPHFPRFRVRIFRSFRVFARWNFLKPLSSWGQRDLPHFPHFRGIGFESVILLRHKLCRCHLVAQDQKGACCSLPHQTLAW